MTLIAGFTENQKSFIISDLRLTKRESDNKNHYDRTLKFIGLNKKVGFFLSGNVNFWKDAIPKLENIISSVTYNNIADINGPFWQELSVCAGKYSGTISGAICFIIDKPSKKHLLLKIVIHPGQGAILTPFEEKSTVIIGSGANIPELDISLNSIYERTKEFYNGDLYCIGSTFRSEIKNRIKEFGSSTYKKLGISPVMVLSILQNDYFCICGEEEEGGNYSSNSIYTYKYEFGKDNNEQMSLKNLKENTKFKILDIHEISILSGEDEIFDPAKVTEEYDPSEEFNSSDSILMLHQAIFPKTSLAFISNSNKEWPNRVLRQIYKIEFITKYRFIKRTLLYTKAIENLEVEDFNKFQQNIEVYFNISENGENSITEGNLFNHKFLSNIIPEYAQKLYRDT